MPLVAQHDILEVGYEHRVRHDGNLVDARVVFKHVDGVFNHHLARHLEELLWCGNAEARSYASCQYDGYISFHAL